MSSRFSKKSCLLTLLSLVIFLSFSCARKTPEQKLQDAKSSLQKQDLLGAIIKLKNLIKEHPESPASAEAYRLLGECYEIQGDFEEARKNYDNVVKKLTHGDPRGQQAFAKRIYLLLREKKHDEAITAIKTVIESVPADSRYQKNLKLNLATIYLDKSETDTARLIIDPLIFEEKDESLVQECVNILSMFYMRAKQNDKAIEVIDKYLEKNPKSSLKNLLIFSKSYLFKLSGDQKNAEKFLKDSEEGYQKTIKDTLDEREKLKLMFELSRGYELWDFYDKANAIYDKIIKESNEEDAVLTAHLSKNDNFLKQKKYDEALKSLNEIEKQFPTIPFAVNTVQERRSYIKKVTGGEENKLAPIALETPTEKPKTNP